MTGKNVVWIILDSIRADRSPFGGHTRNTMPALKRLAERPNAIGTACTAQAIWSQPSVTSMMTGTWPSRHGCGLHNEVLPSQIQTVAERLSGASYRTVGLSVNPYFSADTGLDRGFDRFDRLGPVEYFRRAGPGSVAKFFANIRTYSGGLTADKRKHSPNYLFNEIVKSELGSLARGDDPFAVVAHYQGAHHPYYPSPAFRDTFDAPESYSPEEAAGLAFRRTLDPYETIADPPDDTSEEWDAIRTAYDAVVRQVDSVIGRLVAHIDELGIEDETILIVTSDHGDLIGESGFVSHKLLLHDALVRVPLVVWGSERLDAFDGGPIQHVDVVQTILDEVGASTEGMDGTVLPDESRTFTVSQRGEQTAERTLDAVKEHDPSFDSVRRGLLTAVRTEDWKLVQGEDGVELYELPDETTDRSARDRDRTRELTGRLEEWMAAHGEPIYSRDEAEFSDRVQTQLSDLGYVVE